MHKGIDFEGIGRLLPSSHPHTHSLFMQFKLPINEKAGESPSTRSSPVLESGSPFCPRAIIVKTALSPFLASRASFLLLLY